MDTLTKLLPYVLGLLVLADIATTLQALARPNTYERNPIIRRLMQHGHLWIVVKVVLSVGAIALLRDHPAILAPISALYAYTVWRNYRLASR